MSEIETVMSVDIVAARELCAKATPEPWEWDGDPCNEDLTYRDNNAPWIIAGDGHAILTGDIVANRKSDAWFIVQARTLLPQAIAEIERLRQDIEYYRRALRVNAGYKAEAKA